MKASSRGTWVAGILAIGQVALASHAAQSQPPQVMAFDIKHQALGDALNELARQSGLQIVLYSEVGAGLSIPALLGNFTPTGALERMLSGTQLDYEFINDRTVVIEPKSAKARKTSSISSLPATLNGGHSLLLAQAEGRVPTPAQEGTGAARANTPAAAARDEGRTERSDLAVQEVTVTARRREETLQTTPV